MQPLIHLLVNPHGQQSSTVLCCRPWPVEALSSPATHVEHLNEWCRPCVWRVVAWALAVKSSKMAFNFTLWTSLFLFAALWLACGFRELRPMAKAFMTRVKVARSWLAFTHCFAASLFGLVSFILLMSLIGHGRTGLKYCGFSRRGLYMNEHPSV